MDCRYQCGKGTELYTSSVGIEYDKKNSFELHTKVVADGKVINGAESTYKIQKLDPPTVTMESGTTPDAGYSGTDSLQVIADDRIAEFPVTGPDGTRIQYYFSENEVAGSDFENNIVWNDLNQNDLPLSFPESQTSICM